MKKLFTLVCAVMGLVANVNAASIDDVNVCKHSYVLVFEDWLNGGAKPGKGSLFGDNYFLDVTGGSTATNKHSIDLSNEAFADGRYAKYAEYGSHLNCWRLKNGQDAIAMKVTAKSKVIILGEAHASRYPEIRDAAPSGNAMQGNNLGSSLNTVSENGVFEWIADDDRTIYIGSYNGDYYVSYIIVEANEAPGTPTVKVGPQTFDDNEGLWFREVTCTPNDMVEEGSTEAIPTIVTYTTDGTAPTASSSVYTDPIKCYKNMTVKFQAFMDFGDGKIGDIADGADNEGVVNFLFDAPTITANGGDVTITTFHDSAEPYYYYIIGKDTTQVAQGGAFTLEESATVVAFSKIVNGDYETFTTNSVSQDVYVLNPIKEKKTIIVTAGDVEVDEEATANNQNQETVYMVKNGAISADKKDFFVKNLEFAVVKDAQYQIEGEERYIKMNNTNIAFQLAAGDSVDVKVICSKNSCKTLNADDDPDVTTDRKCYVNVSGTTYGSDDVTAEDGNIIKFGLRNTNGEGNKTFIFQKYSGTGNIMISSIVIAPAGTDTDVDGISNVVAAEQANAPVYNLAGQQVDAQYKGVVIKNGQKLIQK